MDELDNPAPLGFVIGVDVRPEALRFRHIINLAEPAWFYGLYSPVRSSAILLCLTLQERRRNYGVTLETGVILEFGVTVASSGVTSCKVQGETHGYKEVDTPIDWMG